AVGAQTQSIVVFGPTEALCGEITLDRRRVRQRNFDKYPMLRINEAPQIDIILVQSTERPGGIGEPATALIGPAVSNAIFAATGKRLRKMPFTPQSITAV